MKKILKQFLVFLLSLMSVACVGGKKDKTQHEINKQTDNSYECACYDGIGSQQGDIPLFVFTYSNGESLAVCGFQNALCSNDSSSVYKDEQILKVSEFNIFRCNTGESLAEYGALDNCRIRAKKDTLRVELLKDLPVGKSWEMQTVVIGEQLIILENNKIVVKDLEPKALKIVLSDDEQNHFMQSLQAGEGFGEDKFNEISRLEVLSLIGNEEAWRILQEYESFINQKLDGEYAEYLIDAVENVKWTRGNQ